MTDEDFPMQRRLFLLVCLLFLLVGCAGAPDPSEGESSEPFPQPTSEEQGDDAPAPATPTPPLIAIAARSDVMNADGSVTQQLTLQDNSLGIGQVLITAPGQLTMGDGGYVALTIFPAPSATGDVLAPVTETGEIETTQSITQSTAIYPIMKADLTGSTFVIEMNGEAQRLVTTDAPTEWLWSIHSFEGGDQRLVASLSIPVQVEGSTGNTSRVVETFPITITINKTFAQRMDENREVIITTVLGLLGGGLTLGWRSWRNRALRK